MVHVQRTLSGYSKLNQQILSIPDRIIHHLTKTMYIFEKSFPGANRTFWLNKYENTESDYHSNKLYGKHVGWDTSAIVRTLSGNSNLYTTILVKQCFIIQTKGLPCILARLNGLLIFLWILH